MGSQESSPGIGAWSGVLMALAATVLVLVALGLAMALLVYLAIAVGSSIAELNSGFALGGVY